MFKFVVVFAFVAAALAEPKPGVLLSAPYVQPYAAYSTVVSPASTSFSSQSSSVILPSPITYSTPLGFSHFIKKRSADPQFLATTYNSPYNYYPSPYPYSPAAAVYSTPTVYSSPIAQVPIAAHLIKKRSAPLLTPYIAPTTYFANPAISPVISTPYLQTPYYGAQLPLVNAHFIKKRSAEPTAEPQTFFPSTYLTPSTYIKTISTPYVTNPFVNNYYPSAVIPYTATHLIKKRSAEAEPEPAADPSLAFRTYPTTYYSGSPLIPAYPSATLIKSAPIYPANPFVYSTFIKK